MVTRPKYDDGTEYLSYYASLILKEANKLNIIYKDFPGKQANSREICKYLKKKNPKLIFINGHGNVDSLEGDKGEIIFSVDKNIGLLKNKLVYARACHAAINFGKKMVYGNEGCFIGYFTPFSFWMDSRHSAIPSKDNLAKLFLEPSNEIVSFLMKGNNPKISDKKSKKMMIDNIKKILVMEEKKEPGATRWLEVLWNNFEGQKVIGNEYLSF